MIVVVGQSRVDLGEAEMRVLPVDFLRTPTVGKVIAHNLDHLGVGVVDPSTTSLVEDDMGNFGRGVHVGQFTDYLGGINGGKGMGEEEGDGRWVLGAW